MYTSPVDMMENICCVFKEGEWLVLIPVSRKAEREGVDGAIYNPFSKIALKVKCNYCYYFYGHL